MEILKVRACSILIKILLLRAIQLNWRMTRNASEKKKDIFASCCQLNILLPHGLSAVPDKVWTKSKEKFRHDNFFSSVASAVKISKLSNSGSAWSAQKTSQYSLLKDSNSNLFIKWRHTNRYFLSISWRVLIIMRTLHILIFTYTIAYTDCIRLKKGSLYRVRCGKTLSIIPWKTPDL